MSFATAIGELLASQLFDEGPREANRTIADFLAEAIQTVEEGLASKAVKRIGASKGEVSDWLHRRHLPSLPQAVLIAHAYGATLPDALVGKGGSRTNICSLLAKPRRTTFKPYKKRDPVPNLEERLREFLSISTPPSESEAAGMVGTSAREIRRTHPDLCQQIAERRAEWIEQEAHRRRDERLKVIEELVNQMVSEGAIPTIARLEECLVGIPRSFLFQERVACKRICEAGKIELRQGATGA